MALKSWQQLVDAAKRTMHKSGEFVQDLKHKVHKAQLTVGDEDRYVRAMHPRLIGRMVAYAYDPLAESKRRMPYWDTYPLVILTDFNAKGWSGYNLHYLQPKYRLAMLDELYSIYMDRHYDERQKIQVSHKYLNNTRVSYWAAPTFHRYRPGGLRSRVFVVEPNDWGRAALLPLQKFRGAPDSRVWSDSRDQLGIRQKTRK